MKSIFTLLFASAIIIANGQEVNATRTSIANGNATNPFTWDCTCIPIPGDNVIINTNVTLDNDWGYTTGSLTINAGKSLIGNNASRNLAVGGGTFTNNGTTNIAFIYHTGGTFTNNGTLTVSESFANSGSGVITTNNSNFTVNDSLYINATFNNNNMLTAFGTANAGTFNNAGSFTTGDLWNSGTVNNTGLPGLIITHDIYSSGTITNGTKITVANDIWTSETFTNNDYVVIDHSLYTGDSIQFTATFTNNGLVSIAYDMYSNQTVNGSGDFCVAGTTANAGTISGTLDICDLTGGGIDLNSGTVAGTVTFCQSSCAVGVQENPAPIISVYPNPFVDKLTVKMEGYDNARFVLQNLLGQKLIDKNITANNNISVTDFDNGVYFYSFLVDGKVIANGKLLKE